MMTHSELAAQLFEDGFSCTPAVLGAFSEDLGMPRDQALRLATGFGGGIANTQGVCGAVTGALMALGLRHGRDTLDDVEAKVRTYEVIESFLAQFEARHGSLICRELLGCDHEKASDRALYRSRCTTFVRDAAAIVDSLI